MSEIDVDFSSVRGRTRGVGRVERSTYACGSHCQAPTIKSFMLVFVTAVRHPLNSASYARVGRLLDATLHTVVRGSDPDFRVVVVHNEMPPLEANDSRISFLQVSFPPPSSERKSRIDFTLGVKDKGMKLIAGAAAARELNADHIMFIDCDDLMHRDLASYANQRHEESGWFAPNGYIHSVGSAAVQEVIGDFHHRNGSTSIVRSDLLQIPSAITPTSSQAEIVELVGEDYVVGLIGVHGKWNDFLAQSGNHLEPLPFPSTIWEIGTGENASGNLVSNRPKVKIDSEITELFGLTRPSLITSEMQRVTMGSRRLGRKLRRFVQSGQHRPGQHRRGSQTE